MRRAPFFAAVGLCMTGLLFVPYVLRAQENRAARTRCASNMRQLGLATVQYGDDKRFLPHVAKTRVLDGDASSNDTPQSVRALVWFGYHDSPEGFVCPSSDDFDAQIKDPEVRELMRLWFWGGENKGDTKTPPWRDHLKDPALNKTRQLSYGYTRRGYNRNVSSTKRIFADRAVRDGVDAGPMTGNHDDGWNVTQADCTVEFREYSTEQAKQLTSTEAGGSFLALKAQLDDSGFKPIKAGTPASTKGWSGYYELEGKRVRVSPRSYDRRAGRWSFSFETFDKRGDTETAAYGHVAADGSMTGFPGSPHATFKAVRKGETLKVTQGGKVVVYKVAEAPLDKTTIELAALGLVGALHSGNVEAAKAMITKKALAKLSKSDFEALMKQAQSSDRREVRKLMEHFVACVVKDSDGVVRLALTAGPPPPTPEQVARGNEAAAIGALRAISSAQSLFREGDKDSNNVLDYADSLEALGKPDLIDRVLAKGTKNGYRFVVCRAEGDSGQFCWMATASPVTPGKTGDRHFATNQSGVIFYSDKPIPLDLKQCEIKGAKPVGR